MAAAVVAESRAEKPASEAEADAQARATMRRIGFRPPASETLSAMAAELEASRAVELLEASAAFRIDLPNGEVVGEPARETAAAAAAAIVLDELLLLPSGFVASIGLHRIVLCEGLREDGRLIPSLPNYAHTLLLDVDAAPDFLRRLLHHEIFHFADFADDGIVKRDVSWSALNPPGFGYGFGGRSMRAPGVSEPDPRLLGFVTPYAQAAVEEDKAEVFAFMMTTPAALRRRAERDAVLAAKMERVRTIVAALSLDEAFWRRVELARAR